MTLRDIDRLKPRSGEKLLRPGVEALSVLHRASRMIGDPPFSDDSLWRRLKQPERRDHLGYIASERGDPRRLLGIGGILAQHKAVILNGRTTTRCVDHDGIHPGG